MKIINIKRKKQPKTTLSDNGFTIVELMVALSVMSVILIISTIIMIQIGGLYDKGISGSNLQNTTRAVVADISSSIQFSGYSNAISECAPTAPPPGVSNVCYPNVNYPYKYTFTNPYNGNTQTYEYAYCIGTVRYSYLLNTVLGTDTSNNPNNGLTSNTGSGAGQDTTDILWRDDLQAAGDPCYPVDLSNPTATSSSPTSGNHYIGGNGYEMMSDHTRITSFNISGLTGAGSNNTYQVTLTTAFGNSSLFTSSGNCNSQLTQTSTQFCSTSSTNSVVAGRIY